MSELAAKIIPFVVFAVSLAGGFTLGLMGQTAAAIAIITLFALIAAVAGAGPRSILKIRSDKGGFEITRATRQKAESRPEIQRTDADNLVLAMAEHRNNNPDEAIRLDPKYAIAHSDRGAVLYDLNRYDEALAAFDEAIRLDPNFTDAHSNRGNVLNSLNRDDEALEAYDEAIRLDAKNALAHYNRGNLLHSLNRDDEALAAYDEAIRLDPNFTDAHYNRGTALGKLGRDAEAEAALAQAKKLDLR
jgi:tetratricopeptide (TPR) repeat protein